MPYRRLPNTDKARLAALEKGGDGARVRCGQAGGFV